MHVYVIIIDMIVDNSVYTSLSSACKRAGVSFSTTQLQQGPNYAFIKLLDRQRVTVNIMRCCVEKVKGRGSF